MAVSEPLDGSRRFLSVNGKTDAGSGTEDVVTQKFIAHVPLLLHPAPKRVLVIGWGGRRHRRRGGCAPDREPRVRRDRARDLGGRALLRRRSRSRCGATRASSS